MCFFFHNTPQFVERKAKISRVENIECEVWQSSSSAKGMSSQGQGSRSHGRLQPHASAPAASEEFLRGPSDMSFSHYMKVMLLL